MGQITSDLVHTKKDNYAVDEYAQSLDLSEGHYNSQLKFSISKDHDGRNVLDMRMKELRRANLKKFSKKLVHILKLQENYLKTLPHHVTCMVNLKEIYLQHNHFRYFPVQLCSLNQLEVLDMSYNELDSLPYSIGHLVSLTKLDVSYNKIRSLPSSLQVLRHLEELKCHGNGLNEVPSAIFTIRNLKALELCRNNLICLPKHFLTLRCLEKLDLRGNNIKVISNCLRAYLSRLREFRIGDIDPEKFERKRHVPMISKVGYQMIKKNVGSAGEDFYLKLPPIPSGQCKQNKDNCVNEGNKIDEHGETEPSVDSKDHVYVFQSFAFSTSSFSSGCPDSVERSTSL